MQNMKKRVHVMMCVGFVTYPHVFHIRLHRSHIPVGFFGNRRREDVAMQLVQKKPP